MIDITKLDNGLRIVNEYMEDVESVSINVIVKTGSRNETKQNNGISHFLEHMAFKGTLTRNVQQIAEEFDDIGGTANAFTSTAKTAFYTKVLKEYTEKGVEILADILQNSVFLEEEIEKERQVILQELAMTKDDPTDIVVDYFSEIQYANQPYGRSILMWLFVLVWCTDTFAYFVGKVLKLGKHKINEISPKKSYEGLVGGIIGSMFFGGIFVKIFLPQYSSILISLTPLLCCIEQLGDFTESYIKRSFDVKDSGNIIPGHGGFLDRFDGFLYLSPIMLYILEFI